MSRRERRTFTKEFKQQMVDLYKAGKPRIELIREYDLTTSTYDKYVKQAQTTGYFSEKDNLTAEQKELNELRKRKLNKELEKRSIILSRRKISQIMKRRNLVSTYTKAKFKPAKTTVNEGEIANKLKRQFSNRDSLEAIVTDLTYVRVGGKWHYICFILDLFNREIIGYSCGQNKDAELVKKALSRISYPLTDVHYFHTGRGKEFDNQAIEAVLHAFQIERSLSRKGNPYDNAVAESTYKSTKVEFVYPNTFSTIEELDIHLFDYVHWWNYLRLQGSLGYETPIAYRYARLAKRTLDNELGCDTNEGAA